MKEGGVLGYWEVSERESGVLGYWEVSERGWSSRLLGG